MTVLLPDASALRHILADGMVDLARDTWDGDAHWTEAVAADLPPAQQHRLDWLPEPIEVSEPEEIATVERMRRAVFGGAPERPTDYLDQAQILFVITSYPTWQDAVWISAEPAVLDFARRRKLSCRPVTAALQG